MTSTPSTPHKPTRSLWARFRQWWARDSDKESWGRGFFEDYKKEQAVKNGDLIAYDDDSGVCRMRLTWDDRRGEYTVNLPELDGQTHWVRLSDFEALEAENKALRRRVEAMEQSHTIGAGSVEVGDGLDS